LPPAPPTPNTVIRGFSSRISGIFRLMLMIASLNARAGQTADCGRSGRGQVLTETHGAQKLSQSHRPTRAM
jgi:hypothetical protein